MSDAGRRRILFLCTGNSCRSQMAEGWTRHLKTGQLEAKSAGIEARGLDPRAVSVMREAGVEIGGQASTRVVDLIGQEFDYVVTVCDHAAQTCPTFPSDTAVVHAGFDDPPALARDADTEEEALSHYRRVRDEIRDYVLRLPDVLAKSAATRSSGSPPASRP